MLKIYLYIVKTIKIIIKMLAMYDKILYNENTIEQISLDETCGRDRYNIGAEGLSYINSH